MGFFKFLVVVTCFTVVAINVIPDDSAVEPLRALLTGFDQTSLQSRYGEVRSLDHKATRGVYHTILAEAENAMLSSNEAPPQKALTCSLIRSEARRYARSRDGSYRGYLTDIVLQLRDGYVHGLRYLPLAAQKDMRASLALQKPTLYYTALTLKETLSCVAPSLSGGRCPSYLFLREMKNKSDLDILGSCTRANRAYDGW